MHRKCALLARQATGSVCGSRMAPPPPTCRPRLHCRRRTRHTRHTKSYRRRHAAGCVVYLPHHPRNALHVQARAGGQRVRSDCDRPYKTGHCHQAKQHLLLHHRPGRSASRSPERRVQDFAGALRNAPRWRTPLPLRAAMHPECCRPALQLRLLQRAYNELGPSAADSALSTTAATLGESHAQHQQAAAIHAAAGHGCATHSRGWTWLDHAACCLLSRRPPWRPLHRDGHSQRRFRVEGHL